MDRAIAKGAAAGGCPPQARRGGRPRLLVVEGCNGVGKSTAARHLRDRLDAALFHYPPEFGRFRQQAGLDVRVAPLPRLLYYLAATLHLADLVREQLARGHVVCDRYLASPLSLLVADGALAEQEACRVCAPFEPYLCAPDLTLLLTAGHAEATARIRARASDTLTAVEGRVLESPAFFHTREVVLRRQAGRLGPVVDLDTTALSPDQMCRTAWSLVAQALGLEAGP